MKKNSKLGFSLIELSIVILVIGILTVGITKGSRIISAARLTSAQNLTTKSPVNSLFNELVFWLDTTSEKSFNQNEAEDQGIITSWYDINPINTNLINFSAFGEPTYIKSGANGLPVLRFDGVNDFMQSVKNLTPIDFSEGGSQITIFIVKKYYSGTHEGSSIWWSDNHVNRLNIHALNGDNKRFYFDLGQCCGGDARIEFMPANSFQDRTTITTAVRRKNEAGIVRINGTEYASQGSMTSALENGSAQIQLALGGNGIEHADFNEFIVFRTGLKDSEIIAIEKYLSAKWGVPLKGL